MSLLLWILPAWKASIIKHQFKDNLLFDDGDDDDKKKALEFPPSTYNESFYSTSSSSLTINGPPMPYHASIITFVQNSRLTSNTSSSSSSRTLESSTNNPKQYYYNSNVVSRNKKKSLEKVIKDVQYIQEKESGSRGGGSYFWRIDNTKRLILLWQWSVSMGYLEYDHAKHLNALVSQLSSEKQEHDCEQVDMITPIEEDHIKIL